MLLLLQAISTAMSDKEKTREKPFIEDFNKVEENGRNHLVLYNDEVNTFDFVIECLINICEHTTEQAEQCTYLVHYKGKCEVKSGPLENLRPLRNALIEKGLSATIK